MNFDIASELSEIYDLTSGVPQLTIIFIALSGILLLIGAVALIFAARGMVGLRFFPVLYGSCAYLLFYVFIGGIFTSFLAVAQTPETAPPKLALINLLILLLTSGCLVGGRLVTMWFLRKFYNEYCDSYGIGIGIGITEAVFTGITIFFNYALCTTISQTGLTDLVNSYDSVNEAMENISSIMVFYDTPSYYYLLSGLENLMYLVFHVITSVLYYAVDRNDLNRGHIGTLIGFNALMYLPATFYSTQLIFNKITCFAAQAVIFAAVFYICLNFHLRNYKDIAPVVSKSKKVSGTYNQTGKAPSGKMPDFNKNFKNK